MKPGESPGGRYVSVISLAPFDTTCTLFFTHLADRLPGALRISQFHVDDVAASLAGASAMILVRGLFEFENLIGCTKLLSVPRYYFLDDNFMLIREEPGPYEAPCEGYTNDRVRRVLRDFSGVLLATPALMDYFAAHRLHHHLVYYPPMTGERLTATAGQNGRPLTIAFFGGQHLRDPFVRYVYPAVQQLGRETPVRLLAAGIDAGSLPSGDGLDVVCPPYERSYADALRAVATYGVDILVHPSAATANNLYKNEHVLINARMLGAAPIFSNAPPYSSVAGEGVALLCEDRVDDWYDALRRLAADAVLRRELLERVGVYCDRHFGGSPNADAIHAIRDAHPAPGALSHTTRRIVGTSCLACGRLGARVARRLTS